MNRVCLYRLLVAWGAAPASGLTTYGRRQVVNVDQLWPGPLLADGSLGPCLNGQTDLIPLLADLLGPGCRFTLLADLNGTAPALLNKDNAVAASLLADRNRRVG
ncbi:hypothetical protein Slin_4725 [Spirosoma linguale DSM 74]|uniref:Uncharacterized protein n=1 Tax=Spirosoma linguale (strain ATCC 33905 / DSM 74 / LMG 10896 / Claus 1) TaxID=504472 RepID=D2QPP4_SPILD|nr:hypothetical protein Slin_4725 [Spirosoma linguale DSM 74]